MILSNIKVGRRLAYAFGLILLITAMMTGIGAWRIEQLANTTRQLGTTDREKLELAIKWRQNTDLNWVRTRAALLDSDTSRIPMWQAEMNKTSESSLALSKRLI